MSEYHEALFNSLIGCTVLPCDGRFVPVYNVILLMLGIRLLVVLKRSSII